MKPGDIVRLTRQIMTQMGNFWESDETVEVVEIYDDMVLLWNRGEHEPVFLSDVYEP